MQKVPSPHSAQRRTKYPLVWVTTLLIPLGAGLLGGCQPNANSSGTVTQQAVKVIQPEEKLLPVHLTATGTLFGEEETTLSSKVSGRVFEVRHDVGDRVEEGAQLLRLEPTDYQLAKESRQNAFAAALAQLGLTVLPTGEFSVEKLPTVQKARLQAQNFRSRFERIKQLHERTPPLISDQEFADAQTAWKVAENEYQLAKLSAEAQLANARTAQTELAIAAQRLIDTTVAVPSGKRPTVGSNSPPETSINYEVASRHVSVGDYVEAGTPLFRLVDPDPLKLRVQIPERRVGDVRGGQLVTIRSDAYAEQFNGTVARVSPAVKQESRTFDVEILVPNPHRKLKPGMFALAAIELERSLGLTVPSAAITTFAGLQKIAVVRDGKVAQSTVTLGRIIGSETEVVSGISKTDLVLQSPENILAVGTPVKVETTSLPERSRK